MSRLSAMHFQWRRCRLVHACLDVGKCGKRKKLFTLLDLCVSSLRRGHANLLCIVPILTDDPRRESTMMMMMMMMNAGLSEHSESTRRPNSHATPSREGG